MTGHHHLMANMFTAGVTLAQRVLEKRNTTISAANKNLPLFFFKLLSLLDKLDCIECNLINLPFVYRLFLKKAEETMEGNESSIIC